MSIWDDYRDELRYVLTTRHGRAVLEDIHRREDDVVSLDELVVSLHADSETVDGRDQLAERLHHVTLPKLEEFGAIDYNATARRIESQDGELLAQVANRLPMN